MYLKPRTEKKVFIMKTQVQDRVTINVRRMKTATFINMAEMK